MSRRYKRPRGSGLVFCLMMVCGLYTHCAHAGLIRNVCSKLVENLVADDPYQYEFYATAWLEREAQRLEIKKTWGKLEREDAERLVNIKRELGIRENLPHWRVGE